MTGEMPDRPGAQSASVQELASAKGALPNGSSATAGAAARDTASPVPGDETDIWAGRTHWKHYAGRIALWLAANIIGAILVGWAASIADWLSAGIASWIIVGGVLVSGALVVGPVAVTILGRRYRLTSQRLFIKQGILSQTIDQTELIRVDDVRIHKTFVDRIVQLGSVYVLSTDATDRQLELVGIKNADAVAEDIRNHMRAMRKKSLFVETL